MAIPTLTGSLRRKSDSTRETKAIQLHTTAKWIAPHGASTQRTRVPSSFAAAYS